MLDENGMLQCDKRMSHRSERAAIIGFVNQNSIRAVGRKAQDADIRLSQGATDFSDESDDGKIQHCIEADHPPPQLGLRAGKIVGHCMPQIFRQNQCDFVLVTGDRNITGQVVDGYQSRPKLFHESRNPVADYDTVLKTLDSDFRRNDGLCF